MTQQDVHYFRKSSRLGEFLEGGAAARLNLAYQSRSALEGIVLSAALVDETSAQGQTLAPSSV